MSSSSFFRALSGAIGADTAPDSELLQRFVEMGDRTAFELVVRRHAELVWSACRATVPHDRHAAEDAFQATFLALARRAASVRENSVAGWLFRVARNAAGRASARGARRRTEPLPDLLVADAPSVDETAAARERAPVVIEEVDRLATALREPVVLCFFEGCTHAEAAARLGWPVGTVASRLARAKDLLRARLVRRGVALSAAGPVAVLMTNGARAAPVCRVLGIVGAPAGRIPPGVLSLTQGVLSAMRFAQLKTAVAVAFLAVGLAATAVVAVPRPDPSAPAANRGAPPRPTAMRLPQKGKPDLKELEAKELKALKGEWRAVEVETDGKKIGELGLIAILVTYRVTFSDNDLVISVRQGQKTIKKSFKMALALDKPTHHIDLTAQGGADDPDAGKVIRGIYERTGDALKLCTETVFDPKGRPTEFKTGPGQQLFVLERIKDEAEELKALAGEWKSTKVSAAGQELTGKDAEITLGVERASVRMNGGLVKEETLAIRLNPSAVPPTIDLVAKGAKENDTKLVGVYFRQGDKLTICFANSDAKDATRPAELEPGPGDDGRVLIVFERTPNK